MPEIYGCKCRKCGVWHNNVHGDGVCLNCYYGDTAKLKIKKEKIIGKNCRDIE